MHVYHTNHLYYIVQLPVRHILSYILRVISWVVVIVCPLICSHYHWFNSRYYTGHSPNLHSPPIQNTPTTINAIFYVNGSLSDQQTSFLLDSGAAISVVHHKLLPSHTSIFGSATAAVSATGAPLNIAGRATLAVSLGMFTVTHEFTVVRHLTVDSLLGADFLKRYKAVVDCGNSAFYLTNRNHQYTIPVPTSYSLFHQPVSSWMLPLSLLMTWPFVHHQTSLFQGVQCSLLLGSLMTQPVP